MPRVGRSRNDGISNAPPIGVDPADSTGQSTTASGPTVSYLNDKWSRPDHSHTRHAIRGIDSLLSTRFPGQSDEPIRSRSSGPADVSARSVSMGVDGAGEVHRRRESRLVVSTGMPIAGKMAAEAVMANVQPESELAVTPLQTAFGLFEFGVAMHRQSLRRRYPADTDVAIEERLRAWLQHRPGADCGDAVGRRRRVSETLLHVEP